MFTLHPCNLRVLYKFVTRVGLAILMFGYRASVEADIFLREQKKKEV